MFSISLQLEKVGAFGGKKMNKLAVILPIFKRHELTNLCLKNLWHQWQKYGVDVYVVGSEGQASFDLVKNYGFNYLEFENNPLSAKFNAILKETQKYNYDGVIVLGSDNFISDSIIEFYQNVDTSINAVYGFDDIHFYSTHTKILATKSSYNSMKMSVGVGRLFTKELLKVANYNLWRENLDRGIDTSSANTIAALGGQHIKIPYTKEYFILDVKHELNLSMHEIIKTCKVKCELSLMDKFCPNVYQEILKLDINQKQLRMKTFKTIPVFSQKNTVRIEITKEIAGMKVGDTRSITTKLANQAVANGWARIISEPAKNIIITNVPKVDDKKEFIKQPEKSFAEKIDLVKKPVGKKPSFAEKLEKTLEKKSNSKKVVKKAKVKK